MENQGNPTLITLNQIKEAQQFIQGKVHRTPQQSSQALGKPYDIDLFFKLELFQKTGSFKPRGVLNKLNGLSNSEKRKGVISLSAGNHAQALSWGANKENIASTIFMPEGSDKTKIEATQGYGGKVVLTSGNLLEECLKMRDNLGLVLVHPFDDPLVIAGQGTVGLEIMEDLPDVETVIISIGGGGLISGVASAVKLSSPKVRIIGVEPVGSNVLTRSLAAGKPVSMENRSTIADGLNAPFAGIHTYHHVNHYLDQMVNVTEQEIIAGLNKIIERVKVVPEPAAAAAYAALMSGKIEFKSSEKVVCVLCGGNINSSVLKQLLN